MTFKEFMKEVGYNLLTTFWEDFSIADKYGIVGVKDTYRRAFNEWKDDYKFFTELTLVLNHKIWQHYDKIFILGTRKTGCDLIILGGTNCDEGSMDWLFGSLGNENFYVCKPLSFYKSQQEIQKVNPLYAFKVATAYFREQGKVPVFEDSNCRLIKL